MKVLHIIDSVDPRMGGTARAPLDICAGLIEHGEDIMLASTFAAGEDLSYLARDYGAIPVRLFPRTFPEHNFRSPALRRWLVKNVARYDLVEIHGVFSFVPLYAAWACRRRGIPFTVRPHGSLDPFDLRKHALAKRFLGQLVFRHLLRQTACVIPTSIEEAARLVTFGAKVNKVVIPLPVQPSHQTGNGAAFRTAHGIPPDSLVVLFLGRIHPKKGTQFLVPSLASLKSDFPNLWLLMVGTGEHCDLVSMDGLLAEHKVSSWTTRCDFLMGEDKQSAFAASDVFALPSLNENFGIVLVEAMYAGLPILVSTEVYIHDVVVTGGAGLSCEPTAASCRSVLRELLADKDGRRRMHMSGPEVARRHFAQEPVTEMLVQTYRDLVTSTGCAVGRRS